VPAATYPSAEPGDTFRRVRLSTGISNAKRAGHLDSNSTNGIRADPYFAGHGGRVTSPDGSTTTASPPGGDRISQVRHPHHRGADRALLGDIAMKAHHETGPSSRAPFSALASPPALGVTAGRRREGRLKTPRSATTTAHGSPAKAGSVRRAFCCGRSDQEHKPLLNGARLPAVDAGRTAPIRATASERHFGHRLRSPSRLLLAASLGILRLCEVSAEDPMPALHRRAPLSSRCCRTVRGLLRRRGSSERQGGAN